MGRLTSLIRHQLVAALAALLEVLLDSQALRDLERRVRQSETQVDDLVYDAVRLAVRRVFELPEEPETPSTDDDDGGGTDDGGGGLLDRFRGDGGRDNPE